MRNTILIIEDDQEILNFIESLLVNNGYNVAKAVNGIKAIEILDQGFNPDLVLLDLILPDIQGESLCDKIKNIDKGIPVIILTSKDSVSEKVEGFKHGADDYITKPFAPEELLARIDARLRSTKAENGEISIGDLKIDLKKVKVTKGVKEVPLTKHEFKLLEYLALNKNSVLSREMILNKVWDYPLEIESRVVDVYIGYLRKKIDGASKKKLIKSVRGFGYMLTDGKE